MKNELLNHLDFGKRLIKTNDLDPLYCMLTKSGISNTMLRRWSLAYWCFDHPGVSSKIAESKDFYKTMKTAFKEKWPRGKQRRHFRTQRAYDAVLWLEKQGKPGKFVKSLFKGRDNFNDVSDALKIIPEFGQCAIFKAADMGERVLGYDIDFSGCEDKIYNELYKGVALIKTGDEKAKVNVSECVKKLIHEFKIYKAPPHRDRYCGLQEVETIICKYRHYVHDTYYIGKGIDGLLSGLQGWGKLADTLKEYVPKRLGR